MVRRAVIWTFAGQGASFALSFFGSVAVARLLSPYELGVFAVALAVIGVLQVIAAFGVGLYVVREAELTPAALDTAYTVNALLSLGLAASIAAASVPAMRVVYAQLAKDFRERGVVRDTFISGLRMIAAVVGPIVIGVAILSKPLIVLLYGDKWVLAAPLLSFLMVGQFLNLGFAMNWEVYLIRNQLGLQVKLEASRSIFGVVSSMVASMGGVVWVAASSLVDQVFSLFLYVPRMAVP